MIWVVTKRPSEPARAEKVAGDLASIKALVGGADVTLDMFHYSPDVHCYVDDEGLYKKLPVNFMRGTSPIVGAVVFSCVDYLGDEVGFDSDLAAEAFAKFFNSRHSP